MRATDWAVCVVVYTGKMTKLALNQQAASFKFSRVEKRLNAYVGGVFVYQTLICLVMALLARNYDSLWETMGWDHMGGPSQANRTLFDFFTWFILLSYCIPISLYVGLEVAKFIQGMFVNWDRFLTMREHPGGLADDLEDKGDAHGKGPATKINGRGNGNGSDNGSGSGNDGSMSVTDINGSDKGSNGNDRSSANGGSSDSNSGSGASGRGHAVEPLSATSFSDGRKRFCRFGTCAPAVANTSSIIEELGQIDFVLTDKTGTLTENEMRFTSCSVRGKQFTIQKALSSTPSLSSSALTPPRNGDRDDVDREIGLLLPDNANEKGGKGKRQRDSAGKAFPSLVLYTLSFNAIRHEFCFSLIHRSSFSATDSLKKKKITSYHSISFCSLAFLTLLFFLSCH